MSRRTTEADKKKRGTNRNANQRNVKVRKTSFRGLPTPLVELEGEEAEIYKRLCAHLKKADALHDADAFILTAAAANINQLRIAIAGLKEHGAIQVFKNKTRNVSPEFSIFEKANSIFKQHSRLLGLDPRSRQDMLIFLEAGEGDDDDPLNDVWPGAAK